MHQKELANLAEHLNGRIEFQQKASTWAWLGVGGLPFLTYYPSDKEDLKFFVSKIKGINFRSFGLGANSLIRNHFDGIFIRLNKNFRSFQVDSEKNIIISAGLPGVNIAQKMAENGLGGTEFLATIPGTLGGMIKMNAGAHKSEIADLINWVEYMDEDGNIERFSKKECGFGYRKSIFSPKCIILQASISSEKKEKPAIYRKIDELKEKRKKSQPTIGKMAGCFFKNPIGLKAWELIRNSKFGNFTSEKVEVSPIHANFLTNKGNADAFEIEYLAEKIRAEIFRKHKIWLEFEIERIGY